jgi:xylulokinase/glycerol kinase
LATTRKDFTRAILEGITLEIKHNLSLIENLTGHINEVSVAGGLTSFGLFNQIQADAFNKTVTRYDNNEASSLGALMSAGVTLGIYKNYEDAFKEVNSTEPIVFMPGAVNVEKYAKLFIRKNELYNSINQQGVYNLFREVL